MLQLLLQLFPLGDAKQKINNLKNNLSVSSSFEQFKSIALELDLLEGNEEWKKIPESDSYDYCLIGSRLEVMKDLLNRGDNVRELMRILRSGLHRNLGGLQNKSLFSRTHYGTKYLIEEYIRTVVQSLHLIRDDPNVSLNDKFEFFWESRQSFGRSALLLSGGASLGLYHFGVIKALLEQDLLPNVVSGSSVGSIVASLILTKTDEELNVLFKSLDFEFDAFEKNVFFAKLIRFLNVGSLMDIVKLQKFLRKNLGDITFREAHSKTRRVLNITISSPNLIGTSRLLNYLTSPDVLIWSAASASCALPGLFDPVELVEKAPDGTIGPYHPSPMKWSDGSVEQDLPITRLSELFNVNHFIVSQVNPHVVPFISSSRLPSNWIIEKSKNLLVSEVKHRVAQLADLNMLPSFLVNLPGIVSQKYIGDITIVPNLTKSDYSKLLSNPTPEWIKECSIKTERLTWEQIPLIRTHCDIERALDESVHHLRELLNKEPDLALSIFTKKI